jgi:hypothetical protein
MRWAEHVLLVEDSLSAFRVLVGKPERKRGIGEEEVGD